MTTTNERLQAEYERRRAEEGRTDHGTMTYGAGEKQMFVTGETYQNPIVQQGLKRMGAVLYDTNLPDERWSVVPRNITYWESPQRIARYYHAFRTLPPGSQPPPWANREAIDFAYRQLAAANKGQPWYTWGPLTADDPLRDVMRGMAVPPPEAMPRWEQDYYQKLFERKQKDQSRELDRDSIYRALYMQRPNVKPDGTVLWAGTEDDPEKRAEFASDAWSGLAQLSQFEALQRGQTAQPNAEGIPTYGEWLAMVRAQVPAAELEGLDGEALQAIYRIQTGQAQPGDYEPEAEMPDMIAGVPKEEWERMAWWQQAAAWGIPKLSATMPGIVGGLIGVGLGGIPGAVVGAAGMTGASKVAQDNPEGVVAKAFTALDWLALQVERSIGLMAQINASVFEPDKYGPVKEIFENFGPAWQAAQLAYNAMAMTETDEQGRKFWSEYQLSQADPTLHYLPEEFSRGFVAEAGDPVAAYVLTDARRRIMRGDAPEDVIAEIGAQFGWVGEVKDLIGYVLLDPLDLIAPVSGKLASFSAGKLGNVTAAKAFGETGDLLAGSKLYGQMIRQMPPEEAAAFGSISRWLAGVDKEGVVTYRGFTQAAKAREFMNVAENNLASLLADETNPEQMVRFLDAVADMHPGDAVRAAQKSVTIKVGGEDVEVELPKSFQSAEAQPIPLALRDLKGKWHDLLDQWNITRPHAALIAQIAAETGTNPAKLIDDLHNGRVNGDAVLRQYADSLDVRAKAGDEAAAKMLEMMTKEKGRGLTGRQLKEIADNFSGPNGAALTIDKFQAQLHLLLGEGMAKWAVGYWDVKTPPWLIRMSNIIKKGQSGLLLGFNPNYFLNNLITDTATLAWDGLLGFTSAAEEAALVKRLGFVPTRLREGHGMIGDTGPTVKDPIGQAQRAEGFMQAMDDLLGSTRKFQPFVVLTSKLEGLHSRQAVYAGMREYINWFSQPGVGFDHMPSTLKTELERVRPGLADKIEHAIAGGATKAEIEDMVFIGKERLSVRDVLNREELTMLDKFPGLVDQLDADLAKATNPTETRVAFAKAKEAFITRLNEQIVQKMSRTVGDALIKAKVEGTQGVLDMLDGVMADRTTFWLEHMRKMDEAADIAGTLSEGERALHWQRVQTEADRAWTAFENIEGAKWLGVFEALGAGQMTDEGIKVMRLMTDQHDNWSAFYTTRRQLFDEYNDNIQTLPPAKKRTPDQQLQARQWWNETNQKLNADYIDAVLEEDRLQTQLDDLFAEQYGRQFAGESGRFAGGAQTWRGAVRDARRKMAAAMTVYRTGSYPQAMLDAWGEVLTGEQMAYLQQINGGKPIYEMLPADRARAQKQFYQKVYHKLIGNQLEASHANMPGGRKPTQEPAPEADLTRVNQGDSAGSDVAPATDMVAGENARPGASGEVQPSVQEAALPERRVSSEVERATWAATHDPMTRLKNRLAFEGDPNNPEQFAGDWNLRLQAAAEAGDPPPVVAVADLRGLHATNTISYAVGDEYIRTMAKAFADEGLEAYRIGGDEFAVIFSDEATAQTAMEAVTKRLENSIIKTPEGEYYGGKAHFGIGSDLTAAADAQTRAKLADPRADEFSRATYSLSRRSETDPAAEGLAVYPEGSGRGLTPPQEAARAQARAQADTARSREPGAGTEDAEAGRALEPGREPSDAELEAAGIENPDDIATALREGDNALIREDGSQILAAEDLERLGDIQRANANRQIANEYGVATATEAGVPNDRHLLAILNQYGYKVDGLEGIDPAIVREVLERRKIELEAAQPQLQAELDRRIVMHRAETMKRNQEALQLTSYRKPTRDLAVREVYDHYANKFPNDPGKAKAMAEATMVIWDAWARKYADDYGVDADDFYSTFIVERGGSGSGVNLNQEGLAQAGRQLTSTPEFQNWFGDSKVVDENGQPLVMYHGSYAADKFSSFSVKGNSYLGIYLSSDPSYASTYGNAVLPVYVKIENPFVINLPDEFGYNGVISIDGKIIGFYRELTEEVIDTLKAKGYDGIQVHINETLPSGRLPAKSFEIVAFSPEQIKSVFNRGTFDPTNPNILRQGPKGFTRWLDDATGLIHAFEKADVSTFAHEVVHIYTPLFKGDDLKIISGWLAKEYGIKDLPENWHVGAEQHGYAVVNGVKMGEKDLLARAYERYLAEGWAPNRKLRAVFDNIKRWMMEIYRSITGSEIDIKISDELRGLFDRIHGDEEFMASLQKQPEPVAPAPVAESVWGKTVEGAGEAGPLFEQGQAKPDDTLFQTAPPTHTEEFRRWFGDSKVVDENGQPLVVYHGTPTGGFEVFEPKYAKNQDLPFGIHFAEDRAFADIYTFDKRKGRGVPGKNPQTYEVYLSVQNLLDLTQIAMPGSPEYELATKISPMIKNQAVYRDGVFLKNIIDQSKNPQRVERLIREAGYDGIKYNAENRDWVGTNQYVPMEKSISYVVFDPTQVKAVANRGSFDPNDPRILYQENPVTDRAIAPPTRSEEFRRWFGESKVVDENGQPLVVYKGMYPFDYTSPERFKEIDRIERPSEFPMYGGEAGEKPFRIAGFFGDSDVANTFAGFANGTVFPVYLKIEKPIVFDAKGKRAAGYYQFDETGRPFRDAMRSEEYDGAIIKNTVDEGTIYVAKYPEQIKSVFNRGTFDPSDPRILYQENPVTDAAVGAPLGTGDHYMDMPLDEAMLMGWIQYLEPALEGAERKLTGEGAFRPTLGEAESVVSPEMKRELRRYIGQTQMQLKDVNLGALRWGESRRDMALLNYNRRTHFDNFLGVLFPYQFWYTRTAMNWALRTLSRPGIMADYLRLANFGQDQVDQPGYPTRLRGKVGIPMPFLPDWMGDGVYIDPMRMIYPFHQMTTPFTMWAEQRNREQRRAEYLVQDWMEAQEIDAEEGQQAIENMTGPIWDRALAQVRAEDNVGATNPMGIGSDREIRNPIDMIFNVMGPSLPISIGYDVLTGRKEHISQLPVTRLIQNTTALLGIGGERGINIEGPIRRAAGLPEIDRFEDYRIDRELASMVADGLIDHQTAIVAMIERSGEAFTEAQRRVTQVMGTRFFTSSLGLDFFPEGEQEMRLLKEEYDRAWQAYEAGDTEALTAFWDEHPEYEARRAQFTEDPEARLRMFLQRQIWDQYREMNPAEKRATRERFGEVFEEAFLNKETRSYNSIPVEVMAAWAQAVGGRVPETELAGDAGTTPATGTDSLELPGVDDYYSEREKQFPGIQELWDLEETLGNEQKRRLRKQYPMLDEYSVWRNRYLADHPEIIQYVISEDDDLYGLPQDIQGAVFEFRAQRDELFPGVFDVQDHYFAIQGRDEKRAYLAKHPELKRYWSWQRQVAAANVEIAPYILSETSLSKYILGDEEQQLRHPPYLTDGEFEQLPPELLRALAAHIYAGRPLGKGALAEIEAMRRELAPALDIDSFIEMYLKAAVEQ
jgi:GGDEF domain-containing protein